MSRSLAASMGLVVTIGLVAVAPVSTAASQRQVSGSTVPASKIAEDRSEGHASDEAEALARAAESGKRVEVVSERTETDTVFANPDGTLSAEVSPTPIRVEQPDGDLVGIDTDLEPHGSRLEPKASNADTSFSADGNGALADLSLSGGDAKVSMGFDADLGTPTVKDDVASYPIGETGEVMQVRPSDAGFSARVRLTDAPAEQPTYVFPLKLKGLRATLESDQLVFRDADHRVKGYSAPLRMWDARLDEAGEPSHPASVDATLIDTADGGQALQLKPDLAYLQDPSTQYPVIVDPDVVVNRRGDSFVSSRDPGSNFSTSYYVRVGSPNGTDKYRAFERFYIDRYMSKSIVSADLEMYQYYAQTCTAAKTNVYPTQPGVEAGFTWSNQPAAVTGAQYAGSFTGNLGASGCAGNAVHMDVTGAVSGYTTRTLTSTYSDSTGAEEDKTHVATLQLRADNETATSGDKRFCSMNAGPGSGATTTASACLNEFNKPLLSIKYTADLGDKDSYSTTDHKLDDRTELKINNDNGNALVKAQDVQIAGLGGGLNLTRYYNSLSDDTATSFGSKWSLSLGPDVKFVRRNTSRFDYDDPSGVQYAGFTRKSDSSTSSDYNEFSRPAGVGSDLKQNSDGSLSFTNRKSQKVMRFERKDTATENWVLTRVTDRSGNQTTLNYAAGTQRLTSIADASGHTLTFGYTGDRISTITDANGPSTRTWQYGYTDGRLTSYTNPEAKTTNYSWSSDEDARVTQIADPANGTAQRPTVKLATTAGQVTSVRYVRNNDGAPVDEVGFDFAYNSTASPRCESGYDSSTDVTSTDTTKARSTICFKERGESGSQEGKKVIDGNGNKTSSKSNLDEQPSAFANSNGEASGTTTASYGGGALADQLQKVSDPKDSGASAGSSSSLTYDTPSSKKGYKYLPSAKLDSNGLCTAYTYDSEGRLTDSYLDTTNDCSGQTDGRHYQQSFNSDGTIAWSTTPTAGSSPTDADKTLYTYWSASDTGFVTGTKGLVRTKRLPGGSCAGDPAARKLCTTYTYDGLGRIATMTDGRGKVTRYSYDKLDRQTQVLVDGATSCTPTNGTCISYTYDGVGNQTRRVDSRGTTDFTFDRLNRQTQVATPDNSVVTYGYNDDGKLTQLGVSVEGAPVKTWGYTYDAGNQPVSVTGGPGGTIQLGHDGDNKDNYVRFPTTNAVTIDRDFGFSKRPKSITVQKSGAANDVLPDWTYSYQQSGKDTDQVQKVSIDHSDNPAINDEVTYAYSDFKRLTQANSRDAKDWSYTYDAAAELTSAKIDDNGSGASTTYFGYDKAGQLCWRGDTDGADVTAGCPASAPGSNTRLTQDGAGNSLGTSDTPLGYNGYNQVSSIQGRVQGYHDLGNDMRVSTGSAASGGASLVNSSVGVLARKTSAGVTYYTWSPDGVILASDGPAAGVGDAYYFVTDRQETVTALIDSAGNLASFYRYTPYGKSEVVADNADKAGEKNPWRYIGGYTDVEGDGYIKLGARFYDGVGHFTQLDPVSGSVDDPSSNLSYGYAESDPINKTDPSGRFSVWDPTSYPGPPDFGPVWSAAKKSSKWVGRAVKGNAYAGLACFTYKSVSEGDKNTLSDDLADADTCFNPFSWIYR